MCECEKDILEMVKSKVISTKKDIEKNSVRVEFGKSLYVGNSLRRVPAMPITVRYRRVKLSREPYKNITKENVYMIPKFCSFCGEALEADNE